MTDYPRDFPLSTGLEVISLIKSGQLKANRAKLAHSLWVLQGFAQLNIIGDPNVDVIPSSAEAAPVVTSDVFIFSAKDDPLDVLQRVCDSQSPENVSKQIDIPWAQLLQWAISELLKMTIV